MRLLNFASLAIAASIAALATTAAHATYWNLFNIEGESSETAAYVTYGTLADMLNDTNRSGVFEPNARGFGANVIDGGSNGSTYWNLFNIEGESSETAAYVTYGTLADMLNDTNRSGVFEPNARGFGANVVGSGSNGSTYWNLFNIEGESSETAAYVTYGTLADMLNDTNRSGVFEPNARGFGANVVDGGSNGSTYWNLFNIESESSETAAYVTYGTLADMLNDTNRSGVFEPNIRGFGANIVGSGSDSFPASAVPEPAAWALLTVGFAIIGARLRRRNPCAVLAI